MNARGRRICAFLVVLLLPLAGCASLPTSGQVQVGNNTDDAEAPPEIQSLPSGPVSDGSPEQIVEGFLDAVISPTDGWKTAKEFLTSDLSSPEEASAWKPSAGVTIDTSALDRDIVSDVAVDDEEATEAHVTVQLDEVAHVDTVGSYTEVTAEGVAKAFTLVRGDDGQWRISAAEDGIILDEEAFAQVFRSYSLQYYDPTYTHLVPDVRWYPRRTTIAATLTQALLDGEPSSWLAPAVRDAFPPEITLAKDSVLVDSATSVAEVELNTDALDLDPAVLARMRTQLEESLADAQVSEVRFTVNGRDLDAGTVTLDTPSTDTAALVLTEDAFGAVDGTAITALPGVSDQLLAIKTPVAAVDVSATGTQAAVRLDDGVVYAIGQSGGPNELDSRASLISPSMDVYDYVWTVPGNSPTALVAWRTDVTKTDVAGAFPDASAVSHIRVSPDGARIAAVVTVGGQQWVVVAAIVRDDNNKPVELGPTFPLSPLTGTVNGLAWFGSESLGLLIEDEEGSSLITQTIGGPSTSTRAPSGSVALSGASTADGARVLDANGNVYVRRLTTWQEALSGVRVLATQADR